MEGNWTGREEEFNETQKEIRETPCLASFARDRDIIVTTEASRTELGKNLRQKQNNKTIHLIAFARPYLNDAEKK